MITKNREKNRFGAHVVSDVAIKVQKIDLKKNWTQSSMIGRHEGKPN